MQLIYSFTIALFLTVALIPILIRYSGLLQLLDEPTGGRKVHDRAIPRSGGLAIVLGVFLPLLFLLPIENELQGLFWGAVAIVCIGLLDDRFQLHYTWKFAGQIVAVVAVMSGGVMITEVPGLGQAAAPLWVSVPLTFIFLLGATNAVNLSDGLDGLAAGTSLLSLGLVAVFALMQGDHSIALVAMTVIGGLLGFLRFNTFPARIFMGDTGSQFLGYIIACLAVMVTQGEASAISPVLPLLLLGLPILDTMTVMVIRIRENRSPFSPDKNHLHHQLMALGLQHFEAVGAIYLIQVALMISAFLLRFESDLFLLLFYGLFALLIMAGIQFGNRKQQANEAVVETLDPIERRNMFFRRLEWIHHHSTLAIEWMIGAILVGIAVLVNLRSTGISIDAVLVFAVLLMACTLARKYQVLIARVACYCASVFVVFLFTRSDQSELIIWFADSLFFGLALFLLVAIRTTRREKFSLDTQDLLVLMLVIIVPQLPLESLNNHDVGKISLRLAVLMYSCEYILARAKSNFIVLIVASLLSLLLLSIGGKIL